jgi:hypothetical protein
MWLIYEAHRIDKVRNLSSERLYPAIGRNAFVRIERGNPPHEGYNRRVHDSAAMRNPLPSLSLPHFDIRFIYAMQDFKRRDSCAVSSNLHNDECYFIIVDFLEGLRLNPAKAATRKGLGWRRQSHVGIPPACR